MEIIPGMDITGGAVVCAENITWTNSDTPEGITNNDPVTVARFWKNLGAKHLYIADLEGSRYGTPINPDTIKQIIDQVDIGIYLGGGIRTAETARQVFDAGIEKAVIGTYAALENDFTQYMFDTYGDRVIVSLGNLNGRVAIHNWNASMDETVYEFVQRMEKMGAGTIVYNDVNRKGAHGGISMLNIKKILEATGLPIIIGCGISHLDDIRDLKQFEPRITGAVMVSALYKNLVNYKDAVAAAE